MDVLARSGDALQAFLTRPPAKKTAALAASPSWAAPRPCWALVGLLGSLRLSLMSSVLLVLVTGSALALRNWWEGGGVQTSGRYNLIHENCVLRA